MIMVWVLDCVERNDEGQESFEIVRVIDYHTIFFWRLATKEKQTNKLMINLKPISAWLILQVRTNYFVFMSTE